MAATKARIFDVSFKPLPPLPDRVKHPARDVLHDDSPGENGHCPQEAR
jgi:hypothetical protein